jgi:cytochrome c oxidase subunit 2
MPLAPPEPRVWWNTPIGWHEKVWLTVVVALGLAMFIMMPVWHVLGAQNSPTETYRVAPERFWEKVDAFTAGDGVLSEKTAAGIRPLGDDVYLGALRFGWMPGQIVLETGRRYRFHLSSRDVNHGFSIHQQGDASRKANFQVVPGYEYVITMTFDQPGVYDIVCQEYCGIGHHVMVSKFIVQGGK